jgi:hypothetical protein
MLIFNDEDSKSEKNLLNKLKLAEATSEAINFYENQQILISEEIYHYINSSDSEGNFLISNSELAEGNIAIPTNQNIAKYINILNKIFSVAIHKKLIINLNKKYFQALYPKIYATMMCLGNSYLFDYICLVAQKTIEERFHQPKNNAKAVSATNLVGTKLNSKSQ